MGVKSMPRIGVNRKIIFTLLFFTIFSISLPAEELHEKDQNTDHKEHTEDKKEKEFDAGYVIIGHILDSYDWHIADYGHTHITIPLPIILVYEGKLYTFLSSKFHHGKDSYKNFRLIKQEGNQKPDIVRVLDDGVTPDPNAGYILDLSITKNVFSIFLASIILCSVLIFTARIYKRNGHKQAPKGIASFLEPLVLFVRDDIAGSAIPEKHLHRFLPYLLTLFSFIFFNNLFGLVPFFPGGANVTGNISVTLTLALFTFFTLHFFATRDYWKHIFNTPGVPVWLKIPIPLMPIIELVSVFIKPIVLMLRLMANISAGHMIILGFVSLIFVMGSMNKIMGIAISPLSVMFVVFINFLELLVAFIQAYVFVFFSAIFFGMAVEEHH